MRSPGEIVAAAAVAGLEAIEWSSESYSSGDGTEAWGILMTTLRAGLTVASYSALYRAGAGPDSLQRFRSALDSASALHAPNMRIFAGTSAADLSDPARRATLVQELSRLGDEAGLRGITLCLSFGRHTGVQDYPAALALVSELAHPFVRLAWEALPGVQASAASASLEAVGASTALVVARRLGRDGAAGSLADDPGEWRRRLAAYRDSEPDPKMGRFVLIGAVGDASGLGEDASLASDAALLREIIAELGATKGA